MNSWLNIPIIALIVMGCSLYGEDRVKTFTARHVTEENVFSYGSVFVKVNPELKYSNISGNIKVEIMGKVSTPTKKEFHIFARPGENNVVLIETHTRSHPHIFEMPQDLTKNMETIQKGSKSIDGKAWEVYIRAHPQFPEQILSAAKQKGIHIEPYRCGLEIGVGRVINRHNRMYVSYIKGLNDCKELPRNGGVLSGSQLKMVRGFANQFEENITISDQSDR